MSNYILTDTGELYHFGVKGMKWGVRRNRNISGRIKGIREKGRDMVKRVEIRLKTIRTLMPLRNMRQELLLEQQL